MPGFVTSVDIANRACQHVGARQITAFTDTSRQAKEIAFCYDKLRLAELRRVVWAFATRRAALRAVTSSTVRFVPGLWSSSTNYSVGDLVIDSNGLYWISNFNNNLDAVPGLVDPGFPDHWTQYFGSVTADEWSDTTVYYVGDVVYLSNVFYLCTKNGSVGQQPVAGAPWVGLSMSTWATPAIFEPVGPGITLNTLPQNVFLLPNGYLRLAAQPPKTADTANLGTTGNIQHTDWQIEGGLLVSASTTIIPSFRFVADVSSVSVMDALFCEALGARIGYEICETLTQSPGKLQACGAAYRQFMRDARLVNRIEISSTEADEDDIGLVVGPQAAPPQQQPQAG